MQEWNCKWLIFLLHLIRTTYCGDRIVTSSGSDQFQLERARDKFEHRFNACLKYKFVTTYRNLLLNPNDEYFIFVYHEGNQNTGGLGDRLAGIITGFSYALRTNRTFLIQGDTSFEQSFQPWHPLHGNVSWHSWDWSGWKREFAANMTKLHCINPKPSSTYCALDDAKAFSQYKVIKYFCNRSYLCRWNLKKSLNLQEHLMSSLGIDERSNLYEVAGCLLRLVMWPTEYLWELLMEALSSQLNEFNTIQSQSIATPTTNDVIQIGVHFRCGDSSFKGNNNELNHGGANAFNPQCYFVSNESWKGTNFMDDRSIDSPIDAGHCAQKLLNHPAMVDTKADSNHSLDVGASSIIYIASDNPLSSQQINETLNWPYTIRPPKSCHVDYEKTKQCALSTTLHWFLLAQSDYIIMQALIKPLHGSEDGTESVLFFQSHQIVEESTPISAFSRYAAIYSLSPGAIRYGRSCQSVNNTILGVQTHGNWICDPRRFY